MKVFGKEITEEQAKYLLKISQEKYIKDHNLFFNLKNNNFIEQFEQLFDKQNYTYNKNEMNTYDVEEAVYRIIDKGNPKAAYYAACVLDGSDINRRYFENIIVRNKDYEAQIAYLATFDTTESYKIADNIARSNIAHYNLTLLINCPKTKYLYRNIDVVLKRGSIRQRVALAKYVPYTEEEIIRPDIEVEEIRQDVLKSKDPRANYLFAKYISNSFNTNNTSSNSVTTKGRINYITDFYSQMKDTTRKLLIAEHRNIIKESKNIEYCFKLALNDSFHKKPGFYMTEDFFELEDIVLESYDIEHITKFAIEVFGASTDKHIQRLEELGDYESAKYVEQSLAFRDFFAKN